MEKLPTSILIVGRRWFDKKNGNTYSSALIFVDGAEVEGVPYEYGYGDYYQQAAWEKLQKLGIVPASAARTWPRIWCEQNGVQFVSTVSDVARKRDL